MNWDEAHLQGDLEAMQQAREEAIVRAALESAAGWAAFTHGWGNAEDTIRRLASDPANVASIIKKAGERHD
jgi:hypothetical protein